MLFRNPRLFSFVLIAIGTGVVLYYGEQWHRLPQWSEAEVEQSVELNLALDLQRRGPHLQPAGEKLAELRDTIRAEVRGEIDRERKQLERWLAVGLLLCAFGGAHWLTDVLRRRTLR